MVPTLPWVRQVPKRSEWPRLDRHVDRDAVYVRATSLIKGHFGSSTVRDEIPQPPLRKGALDRWLTIVDDFGEGPFQEDSDHVLFVLR